MGKAWPFTIDDGEVICTGDALLFHHSDRVWAINGLAMTWKLAPDIRDNGFWADDSRLPGAKISISELQEKARSTCQ